MSFDVNPESVNELLAENFRTALRTLLKNQRQPGRRLRSPSDPRERTTDERRRIEAKAQQVAEAQTRRQVGPETWQRYTNWRAVAAKRARPAALDPSFGRGGRRRRAVSPTVPIPSQ